MPKEVEIYGETKVGPKETGLDDKDVTSGDLDAILFLAAIVAGFLLGMLFDVI